MARRGEERGSRLIGFSHGKSLSKRAQTSKSMADDDDRASDRSRRKLRVIGRQAAGRQGPISTYECALLPQSIEWSSDAEPLVSSVFN